MDPRRVSGIADPTKRSCLVTLVWLLRVVVDQALDVGLGEADLGEDLVGGGGPDERLGAGVPVGDVVADLRDQDSHEGEGAAADGLSGDDPEPDLNLVEPGRS